MKSSKNPNTNAISGENETIVTISDYSKINSLGLDNEESKVRKHLNFKLKRNKDISTDDTKKQASPPVAVENYHQAQDVIPKKDEEKNKKIKLSRKEQLTSQTIRRFEQLMETLKKETQYILTGKFRELASVAEQKAELINEYLRLRKELRITCGDESNWLSLLSQEQLQSLRETSNKFEVEFRLNRTALKRASNSVQEVMDIYYQAVRETCNSEGIYTSSGQVIQSALPSLSFEKEY